MEKLESSTKNSPEWEDYAKELQTFAVLMTMLFCCRKVCKSISSRRWMERVEQKFFFVYILLNWNERTFIPPRGKCFQVFLIKCNWMFSFAFSALALLRYAFNFMLGMLKMRFLAEGWVLVEQQQQQQHINSNGMKNFNFRSSFRRIPTTFRCIAVLPIPLNRFT